jgi:hypothetical protein
MVIDVFSIQHGSTVSTTWIKVYFAAVPPNSKALFSATSSALEKSTETAMYFLLYVSDCENEAVDYVENDCETYL